MASKRLPPVQEPPTHHCSLHTHSRWSDGGASIGEMLAAAEAVGLAEFGISDHFTLHPRGKPVSWAMPVEGLPDYIAEVEALHGVRAPGSIPLRLGLEVDWFPGHAAAISSQLAPYRFDYLIGSVHYVGDVTIDGRPEYWRQKSLAERRAVVRDYWRAIHGLAVSGRFDIVGHLDLYKKFDLAPDDAEVGPEVEPALDAIARAGLVVELNTAGWHRACRDGYPSRSLLERCFERDIPSLISSDAHTPEHLARDFERASERLRSVGYRRVVTGFEARRMQLGALG